MKKQLNTYVYFSKKMIKELDKAEKILSKMVDKRIANILSVRKLNSNKK